MSTYYTAKLCSGGGAAPNCTDANNGLTRATAKLTVGAGIGLMSGGDTLIIGDGTYVEAINDTIDSGSSGAPTIIQAENRNAAILKPTTGALSNFVVLLQSKSWITFDGIDMDCASTGHSDCQPIYVTCSSATHFVLKNGKLQNGKGTFGSGFEFENDCGSNTFQNMDVLNNGSGALAHGAYISSADNLVENCRFIGNSGYGVQIYDGGAGQADDNVIRFSWFEGNGAGGGGSAGLLLAAGARNKGYGNIIVNNARGAQVALGCTDCELDFNTIWNNGLLGIWIDNTTSGSKVRDNISYSNGTDAILDEGTGSTVNHNLDDGTDPEFVAPLTDNFRLQATSPARDAGISVTGITTDYEGKVLDITPDLGALQYTSAVPPDAGVPPTDDFDSYSVAANLDTLNGGTDWAGAWDDQGADTITIQTAPAGGQGGKAARLVCTTECVAEREIDGIVVDGIFYFQLRSTTTAPTASMGVFLEDAGGNTRMAVRLAAAGNTVQVFDDTTGWTSLGVTYAADTWVQVALELNSASNPGQYRVKVDGGSYSSWYDAIGLFSAVAFWQMYNGSPGHTLWVDAIGVAPSAPAVDSIAKSILKKVLKDEEFDFGIPLVSLHTGPPGLTGANEVTGGSYAKTSSLGWDSASGGVIQNTLEILWASGFPLVTVTHVGLWSSDGSLFIAGRALNLPKTVVSGRARFAPGELKFSVSPRFSTYLANKLLDYMMSQVAFTTAPVYGAIHTGALDTDGGGEDSTTRQQLQIADWADDGTESGGGTLYTLLYEAAETWAGVTAGALGRIGLWDALTSGNFLMWGPDLTIPGTTVTAEANQISATITQTP